MSRLAKKPIPVPAGVELKFVDNNTALHIKGKKGEFTFPVSSAVKVEIGSHQVSVAPSNKKHPMVGTTWSLLKNMIQGVHQEFDRKLSLVGVGYRAKIQGNALDLSLGFSHPTDYKAPKGVSIDVPSNTEIVLKGASKQQLGEVAAKIRRIRPPESYKGKGVRYADEVVVLKETKKK